MKKLCRVITILLCMLVSCGCVVVEDDTGRKYPSLRGTVSGVPDYLKVTVNVLDSSDAVLSSITRMGSGNWEVVVSAEDVNCRVTVVVDGYESDPPAYRIRIVSRSAYVIVGQTVTTNDVFLLDFKMTEVE